MKLNERLSKLSKNKIPKRLQKGVVACKSECDAVLQKARIEKRELETALESRDAGIDKLKKEVEFHRSLLRVKGMLLCYMTHACIVHDSLIVITTGRPYQSQSSSSEGTSNPGNDTISYTMKVLLLILFISFQNLR